MFKKSFLTLFFIVLLVASGYGEISEIEKSFPEFKGPYLGQTPPWMEPEVFAPEIFGIEEYEAHDCPVFSADGNEFPSFLRSP